MWIDLELKCDAKDIGFKPIYKAEIIVEVNVEYVNHYDDNDGYTDIDIRDFNVSSLYLKHKLLDSFSNDKSYDDIWDCLSLKEEQKLQVNNWVKQKLREKETISIIEEICIDMSTAYHERMYDR